MTSLPPVSDHTVLRYLEREHGVPVEAVRTLIAILAAGGEPDGTVIVGRRVKIVLDNGMAVTCLKKHWTRFEDMPAGRRR